MTPRRTVARCSTLLGQGLHTGRAVRLAFHPAPPEHGIRFRRTDLEGQPEVPAVADHVTDTHRRTVLARDGVAVETVEHVLAAVTGVGIDDLVITLDGPEVPILDGSALEFASALTEAEPHEQAGPAGVLEIPAPFDVTTAGATYRVEPADDLVLDVTITWAHPCIGRQRGRWTIHRDRFVEELAAARTFGFASDRASLTALGLAAGASTANTIALSDTRILNGPLRWPDEFVRHKALDLLGDLTLLGARLRATVTADRPSHHGNRLLVQALRERAAPVSRVT